MENKRFEITETEGSMKGLYVIVDKETGVNYLMAKFGIAGGLCWARFSAGGDCRRLAVFNTAGGGAVY